MSWITSNQWVRFFAFCGQCWEEKVIWAKGNVGYCLDCRPDWHPELEPLDNDGSGVNSPILSEPESGAPSRSSAGSDEFNRPQPSDGDRHG